jgi:hypothetical protein
MARHQWILVLVLLAGCSTARDDQAAEVAAIIANGKASLAAAGAVVPIVASPSVPVAPAETTLFNRVVDGSAARPADTHSLIGAAPEALRRWLGEPGLRRPEGPGEVWLYAGAACALDLVFYQTAAGMRVAHAEARASGAQPRTEANCLQELAQARGAGAMPRTAGAAAHGNGV